MRLVGANPSPKVRGEQELAGKSHYFTGNDPTTWRVNIPHYSKVHYQGVYPGIDLVYYGNQQRLEYDFVVAPGGDPRAILLRFAGTAAERGRDPLKIDGNGDLVMQTDGGEIRQRKAAVFQEINGISRPVFSRYVLRGKYEVGFDLGPYDASRPLVIDPVLSYSATGIGGSAIAVDSDGNAYLTGVASPGFVTTPGAFQAVHGGGTCVNGPNSVPCPDILVAKLDPSGTELIYSTFLGGSGSDYSYGIAVDWAGNAYVTGTTTSTDFPTTPDAFQNTYRNDSCSTTSAAAFCNSAFVAKLNATGTALAYSTYLHGDNGGQGGNSIAVDSSGCAYVTGDRGNSGFVTKLNPTGSAPVYSTSDVGGSAIAVDSAGNAYVTGRAKNDSVVTKLNARGTASLYSFRLGGRSPSYVAPPQEVEALTGIAVDSAGNAYVTGYTAYRDFPTTPGTPFPTAPGAGICGNSLCRDAFVTKLNVAGTALVYSTYLGGNSIDYSNGIAVDPAGNAYVTGVTHSANFPTTGSTFRSTGGGIFVTKLNAAGTALVYSVTLGSGNSNEGGNGIAVDPAGNAYVTGEAGADFPVTPGTYQPPFGRKGSFVAKLFDDMTLFVPVILSSSGQNNSFFTSELTLTNRAGTDATLDLTYTAGFGGGSGRATDTLAAGRQRVVPDAIAYLRSLGLPIPDSGNRGGTLAVRFSGLASPSEGAVTVRTTTTVARGRAGLAYPGISRGLNGTSYLCGLRQNTADRTDVVVQNAGSQAQGDITLQLTIFSGNPVIPASRTLEERVPPGGFKQIPGILLSNGLLFSNGFVRIERIRGTAPYYAYAVISDQASSDESFVTPSAVSSLEGRTGLTLPVVVETSSFSSELVLTNGSVTAKALLFTFVADGIQARDSATNFAIALRAREQLILPNFVQWLRQHGVAGLSSAKQSYVGSLFMTVESGDISDIFLGARTSTAAGGGGRYGVFYSAVPYGMASTASTWLYGLQQNSENRTNLGLVNTGEADGDPDVFRIEIFNGETGLKASSVEGITLNARRLTQIGSLLEKYAPGVRQGYIRVTRVKGSNPFIAYYVINDGGQPGERSGDGAFVFSAP
jgi:Beta-propeller repeat